MDNIRIKNAALKMRGGVEKSIGKLTGNKKLEARGKANEEAASTLKAPGNTKDAGVKGRPGSK